MSDTPRTDHAKFKLESGVEVVVAVVASQLERELNAAILRAERAEKQFSDKVDYYECSGC